MQQTRSYWRVVAVAGVLGMAVATACTVTTSTDDSAGGTGAIAGSTSSAGTTSTAGQTSTAGSGGAGTAGSSGSTSSAGTTSTGGAGGTSAATPFQCDEGDGSKIVGTPASCEATAGNKCSECTHDHCCTEFSNCYAVSPGNVCGYGGPMGEGEIVCTQACIIAATSDGGVADAETITACAMGCVTPKDTQGTSCGTVGARTSDLVGCLKDNCSTECFGG